MAGEEKKGAAEKDIYLLPGRDNSEKRGGGGKIQKR